MRRMESVAKKKPSLDYDCWNLWRAVTEFHLSEKSTIIELDLIIDTILLALKNHWTLRKEYEGAEEEDWIKLLRHIVSVLDYYEQMKELNLDFAKFNSKLYQPASVANRRSSQVYLF